jgi:hypothetical protein
MCLRYLDVGTSSSLLKFSDMTGLFSFHRNNFQYKKKEVVKNIIFVDSEHTAAENSIED